MEICHNFSNLELSKLEDEYILQYDSKNKKNGYNLFNADRRYVSEYHHHIMIEANKKAQFACYKKIYQYGIDGKFIKQHNSINDAIKQLFPKMSKGEITNSRKGALIGRVCNRKGQSAFGYIWSFDKLNKIQYDSKERKIIQYDLNENQMKVFKSIAEASRSLNIKYATLVNGINKGWIVYEKYKFKDA